MSRLTIDSLPEPWCEGGFPWTQLTEIMSAPQVAHFSKWMSGQTMMLCTAQRYDHEKRSYYPSGCDHPHGQVVYRWDLEAWLRGAPVTD